MNLIQHHIKYKEIHGEDEVTWISPKEHRRLHRRLRKEGRCNIPSKDLHKISLKAHHRTQKGKETVRKYLLSDKGKAKIKRNSTSEKHRTTANRYRKCNVRKFCFSTHLDTNIYLSEIILYNLKTGVPCVCAYFKTTHPENLLVVDI